MQDGPDGPASILALSGTIILDGTYLRGVVLKDVEIHYNGGLVLRHEQAHRFSGLPVEGLSLGEDHCVPLAERRAEAQRQPGRATPQDSITTPSSSGIPRRRP